MSNKNRFLILEIRDTIEGQKVLWQYLRDPKDPKYNDLPSELLTVGKEYFVDFTPVEKEGEEEFNEK